MSSLNDYASSKTGGLNKKLTNQFFKESQSGQLKALRAIGAACAGHCVKEGGWHSEAMPVVEAFERLFGSRDRNVPLAYNYLYNYDEAWRYVDGRDGINRKDLIVPYTRNNQNILTAVRLLSFKKADRPKRMKFILDVLIPWYDGMDVLMAKLANT